MSMNHLCSTCPTNVFSRACIAVRQAQNLMFIFMRDVSSATPKIKIMLSIPFDLKNTHSESAKQKQTDEIP